MPDPTPRPVPDEKVVETIAFGLRYEGRRRVRDADDAMARITAARLVKLLRASGYQVSKASPVSASSTTEHIISGDTPGGPRLKP